MIPNTKVTIRFLDGATSECVVRPRTQIAFERKFNVAITSVFNPEAPGAMRFEYLYFMAYHASKASQEFDVWLDLVDGIDVEVEDTVDPTLPVPSGG